MTTDTLLKSLVSDLWMDLQEPAIFWQLAVLAVCLAIAWWRSRASLAKWRERDAQAARSAAEASLSAETFTASPTTGGPDAPAASEAAPERASVRTAASAAEPNALTLLRSEAARQALARLLFPLYTLVLLLIARPIVGIWQKTTLLQLAIALTMAAALARTIVYAVSKLTRTPALVAFERIVVVVVWAAMALYITGYWADVVEVLESIVFPVGKQRISLWSILSSGFWIALTMLAALWLGGFLETRLLATDALDASLRAVFSRLLRALLLMVAVLLGLSLVGLDITALSVFGGALGVGIGLGLQRIASNYISGFIVLIERMIRIGDVVRVDAYTGEVRAIRTRFTVIRSGDGIEYIVPNEMLTSLPVQNFTTTGSLRAKTTVQIAYSSDVQQAARLAVEAALSTPRVLPSPPPVALLTEFAADGLTLDVSFSVGQVQVRGGVQSEVNQAILRAFQANGIDVPFRQHEIRILGGSGDKNPPDIDTSP